MAKVPGGPYYPLNGEGRSVDDPPPYSELDPTGSLQGPRAPPQMVSSPAPGALPYIVPTPDDSVLRARAATAPEPSADSISPSPAVVTRGVPLASKSIDVVCPHCQTDIRTSIEKRPGLLAYLSGAVIACLCCFCGCCLIPCCIDECMEVKHTCPNCDGLIGKYRL